MNAKYTLNADLADKYLKCCEARKSRKPWKSSHLVILLLISLDPGGFLA